MANAQKTGLVITAHPGDFVWRAGGAIALHAKRGLRVKILCLSYGERGESQFAWKKAGVKMEEVKAQRREEAEAAAALLGAEIEFMDAGDYPLRTTEPMLERDRDKNPVVALREIAGRLIKPEEAKEEYIRSLQKHAEVDEPEEARPETDDREDPTHRQVTEEELLRALTTEAQRRAEPQPEPEADYDE